MKLTALIMVGNVASGKTTWIKNFLATQKDLVAEGKSCPWAVVSKDAIRRMIGGGEYVYDENNFETFVHDMSKHAIKYLLQIGINVICDETNEAVITRAEIIEHITESAPACDIIAVVLPKLTKEETLKRKALAENSYGQDLKVWEEVWASKNSKYVEPHEHEGFKEIWRIK